MGLPPPYDLMIGQIVETWHIPPSQLMQEDAQAVFKYWKLNRTYEKGLHKRPKHVDEFLSGVQ